ncbi:MAG: DNA-binding protein [Nitrospirae bacterium]|nr:MAG: DNA-binding protein [Nitrospirota bacterium]
MSLMSGKELAGELGVNAMTVWRAYRKGQIPGERIGRITRFDLESVRKAMRHRAATERTAVGPGGARIGDSRPRTGPEAGDRRPVRPPKATPSRRQP